MGSATSPPCVDSFLCGARRGNCAAIGRWSAISLVTVMRCYFIRGGHLADVHKLAEFSDEELCAQNNPAVWPLHRP